MATTKTPRVKPDPEAIRAQREAEGTYVSPLRAPEPDLTVDEEHFIETFTEVFEEELTDDSKEVLATIKPLDDGRSVTGDGEILPAGITRGYRPRPDDFLAMQGGKQYLPARLRIVWMRAEAASHGWGIVTHLIEHAAGEVTGVVNRGRSSVAQVVGGYALFKASIIGDAGQTIAEGTAMERSETFGDFYEKAETSAIARALAVAGFGTESALEIDEGFIADGPYGNGPVQAGGQDPSQPINIAASQTAQGVMQGGRQTHATQAQVDAIFDQANIRLLSPEALESIINDSLEAENLLSTKLDIGDEPSQYKTKIAEFLSDLTFAECGVIVKTLMTGTVV